MLANFFYCMQRLRQRLVRLKNFVEGCSFLAAPKMIDGYIQQIDHFSGQKINEQHTVELRKFCADFYRLTDPAPIKFDEPSISKFASFMVTATDREVWGEDRKQIQILSLHWEAWQALDPIHGQLVREPEICAFIGKLHNERYYIVNDIDAPVCECPDFGRTAEIERAFLCKYLVFEHLYRNTKDADFVKLSNQVFDMSLEQVKEYGMKTMHPEEKERKPRTSKYSALYGPRKKT